MNSFESFLKFIKSGAAMGLVATLLVIIVLLPFILLFFGVVVIWAFWKHHNHTCQHFQPVPARTNHLRAGKNYRNR